MVGERGFEPPTPWSRTRCSTRLSHSPNILEVRITVRQLVRLLHEYAQISVAESRALTGARTGIDVGVGFRIIADFLHTARSPVFARSLCPVVPAAGSFGDQTAWEMHIGSLVPQRRVGSYFFSSFFSSGSAPGKMPSSGARSFSIRSGSGRGLRGIISSRCAAL